LHRYCQELFVEVSITLYINNLISNHESILSKQYTEYIVRFFFRNVMQR